MNRKPNYGVMLIPLPVNHITMEPLFLEINNWRKMFLIYDLLYVFLKLYRAKINGKENSA